MRSEAFADIAESVGHWRLWGRLGFMEVRRRYRRTVLGPFWTTLSMAILIGMLGFLFATLWKMEIREYLPYLASGFVVWLPVAAIITESCSIFTSAEPTLKQTRLPLMMFAFIVVWRNMIVFGHHIVVYFAVVMIFPVPFNWNTLLVVPGLFLLWFNAIWIAMLIGAVAARYRDVQPLLTSMLQILIFVTPIFWPPDQLGRKAMYIVDPNPLYHFIIIVRAPLLGTAPDPLSWYFVLVVTVVGWTVTLLLFGRIRRRLPYWL